jgi:AcrR family transcriptional regulator
VGVAATGKGARTRQRIVHCAAAILAERGVHGTNLADVVQAARVTKGALYFHFTSKDELILGVEHEYHVDSHRMVATIERDQDPLHRLVLLSFALLRRQLTNSLAQAHSRLMLARVTPQVQSKLIFPPIDWTQTILEWLGQAEREGLLPADVDLLGVAETLDDCLIGAVTGHQVEHRSVAPLSRIALLWRMFLLPALAPDPLRRADLERLIADEEKRPPDPDPVTVVDLTSPVGAVLQPVR